jgi:hypothetical protein
LALVYNFAQPYWGLGRVTNGDFEWLVGPEEAPGFVHPFDAWNHLRVDCVESGIRVYCNGAELLAGGYENATCGTYRLVGLYASTFELGNGEVEYDDFRVTPLRGE